MRPALLDPIQLQQALERLSPWTLLSDRPAIRRSFTFKDFNAAFAFMCRVAMMAEKLNHHPEWSNVYNRVDVVLSTHDANGVTELDLRLAEFCDAVTGAAP